VTSAKLSLANPRTRLLEHHSSQRGRMQLRGRAQLRGHVVYDRAQLRGRTQINCPQLGRLLLHGRELGRDALDVDGVVVVAVVVVVVVVVAMVMVVVEVARVNMAEVEDFILHHLLFLHLSHPRLLCFLPLPLFRQLLDGLPEAVRSVLGLGMHERCTPTARMGQAMPARCWGSL
jgi:hypothetical protein